MHGIQKDLQDLHTTVIAVSPEVPDNSLTLVEKHELTFPVLSDVASNVAKAYNVAWTFSDELQQVYLNFFKLDLSTRTAQSAWTVPVPATFVIDENRVIRHCYVNPDYTKRMDPEDILHALKAIQ